MSAGGTWSGEFPLKSRAGEEIQALVTDSPLLDADGAVAGVVGVTTDLRALKQAELRVRESEELFRAIFDHAPLSVVLRAEDGRLLRWNRRAETLLGLSGEEIAARHFLDVIHPGDREREAALFAELVAGARDDYHLEKRYLHRDGSTLWAQTSVSAIRDPEGRFRCAISMVADITERRRAEQAVRTSRAQLRSLTRRLDAAREEEQKRLAHAVHDELGQGLSGLKLDLAWLERRLGRRDDGGDGELRTRVAEMTEALDRTLGAVGRLALELRPVVLDDLGLEAAVEWALGELERRSGLDTRLDSTLAEQRMEPEISVALFRILQEALTNVARHAAARRVEVDLRRRGDELLLEVRDDGVGIAPQPAASLGLLGMEERARAVGGRLEVARRRAGGTRVTARVPWRPARPESSS